MDGQNIRYMQVLRAVHAALEPKVYLEIGVRTGRSLALARGRAVAIDPDFGPLKPDLRDDPRISHFEQTSDAFFAGHDRAGVLGEERVDFAFIDGLHHADQVIRDFAHVERWSRPGGAIAIHDAAPERLEIARRAKVKGDQWAGDVWRIVPALREHRPDLRLTLLDAAPTGLLLVSGLNPDADQMDALATELAEPFADDGEEERAFAAFRAAHPVGDAAAFVAALAEAGYSVAARSVAG